MNKNNSNSLIPTCLILLFILIPISGFALNRISVPKIPRGYSHEDSNQTTRDVSLTTRKLVYIQGGTFRMGNQSGNGDTDEFPVHEVTLNSFLMGKYEVTQSDYIEVMNSNPSYFSGDLTRPVDNVCFYNAIEYCNKLSFIKGLQPCYEYIGFGYDTSDWPLFWNASDHNNIICHWDNNGYRLPSEAEWEYAAKGGQHTNEYQYAGSNNLNLVGWYSANSSSQSHPVGAKNPNELGLYDMSGNIWEIVWDYYGAYNNTPQSNPIGPTYGIYRVFRGGMWYANANYSRITNRSIASSASCASTYGFRVARSIPN